MDGTEAFWRLALALGIGFLVGIERGRHTREEGGGERIAGVRTFALMGLLGGVTALVSRELGAWVLGGALLSYGALIVAAHLLRNREAKDFGITTEVAELLVFMLGALAVLGDMTLAASAAVATLALLSAKPALHHWVRQIKRLELTAAVELLVLSVVLLPVLPNQGFGPGAVLNPYELWWLVVLVAGISFVGYLAMKLAGPRGGLLLTAVFGGLASSTALTISFARLAGRTPQLGPMLAAGVAVAAGILFVRLLVLVTVVNPPLGAQLVWPASLAFGAGLISAVLLGWEAQAHALTPEPSPAMPDPSEVATALKFGALLAVIMILAHYAREWLGEPGLYALAAISGLTDADAISLSLARMGTQEIAAAAAVSAIMIAAVTNTLVKLAIVATLAGRAMAWRVGLACAGTVGAAAGGLLLG